MFYFEVDCPGHELMNYVCCYLSEVKKLCSPKPSRLLSTQTRPCQNTLLFSYLLPSLAPFGWVFPLRQSVASRFCAGKTPCSVSQLPCFRSFSQEEIFLLWFTVSFFPFWTILSHQQLTCRGNTDASSELIICSCPGPAVL